MSGKSSSPAGATCPRCGAQSTGAFCAACGAPLRNAQCHSCGSTLSPGARFCHRCGAPAQPGASSVPATQRRATGDPLPWAIAAIALVALIALVAGQNFRGGSGGPAQNQQASSSPRPPSLDNMTPRQITDRLFNRIMTFHEAGQLDSVKAFAVMAIPAFDLHDSLDLDLRYDLGRIAEVSGVMDIADAQADTILREQPDHLLGLTLATNLARARGDSAAVRSLNRRLLQAEKKELELNRPEYTLHRVDIERALAAARGGS